MEVQDKEGNTTHPTSFKSTNNQKIMWVWACRGSIRDARRSRGKEMKLVLTPKVERIKRDLEPQKVISEAVSISLTEE